MPMIAFTTFPQSPAFSGPDYGNMENAETKTFFRVFHKCTAGNHVSGRLCALWETHSGLSYNFGTLSIICEYLPNRSMLLVT